MEGDGSSEGSSVGEFGVRLGKLGQGSSHLLEVPQLCRASGRRCQQSPIVRQKHGPNGSVARTQGDPVFGGLQCKDGEAVEGDTNAPPTSWAATNYFAASHHVP